MADNVPQLVIANYESEHRKAIVQVLWTPIAGDGIVAPVAVCYVKCQASSMLPFIRLVSMSPMWTDIIYNN